MITNATPQNILIDTDLGDDVDDVLAIAFALLRPELAVRAITTVSYDTEKRCHLAAQLLRVTGRTDVPVAPGMAWPISPLTAARREKLADFSSSYILNHYPIVDASETPPQYREDAVSLMARMVEEHAGNIALVAIGPLTNIAVFLRRYPHLVAKVQWIAIMGGEVELNRHEHNINWDATAADIVFSSGVPLFVGTWSATRKFVLTPADCERIKALRTPLGDELSRCIEAWWPHKAHKPGPVMYDIAPILWSYDRRYYPTKTMSIQVETGGGSAQGMTTHGGDATNIEISEDMLADEVHALYMETICGRPATATRADT